MFLEILFFVVQRKSPDQAVLENESRTHGLHHLSTQSFREGEDWDTAW
jgi:hypothetical protein